MGKQPRMSTGVAGPATWSSFWRDFADEGVVQERCYLPAEGRRLVDRHWAEFADERAPGDRLLDLGCGAGVVGRALLDRRNDLHVTGVDWADVPVAMVPNLTVKPWVSMEALPFEDGSFDGAVSLFGIEYGEVDRTAREVARVLRSGARFSFLVHHADSETVREGATRRRALRALLSGKAKSAFLAGNPGGFQAQRQALRAQFQDEPNLKLFADALTQRIARPRGERQAFWDLLVRDLGPELALLGHLERSAKSPAAMGAWLGHWLTVVRRVGGSVLRRACGEPVAWRIEGVR